MTNEIKPNASLNDIRYEIRGQLTQRARDMEREGYEIISLNIGNAGLS
jgi:alanine-synthesizing transaminase